jgi:hypothetical protein
MPGGVVRSGTECPTRFRPVQLRVKVDADKRLIVVLAALEMAQTTDESGKTVKLINTHLSEKGEQFRKTLLQDNANLNDDLRRRISTFVSQYKKRRPNATDAEIVAPFISMAYTLTPPPEMADPVIVNELPGELLDVLDFAPLAREFYRRSTIAAKIDDYIKLYREEATVCSGSRQKKWSANCSITCTHGHNCLPWRKARSNKNLKRKIEYREGRNANARTAF